MATNNVYPVYEAKVGALGYVRGWCLPEENTYCFTYFNGEDYTPLFLSEEAAYYTWAFLSMMHPEAQFVLDKPLIKTKANKCKPAKKKPTVKKRQVKAK
jgi:hypothetical protein